MSNGGSVAISMLSEVYGCQMPPNRGRIANLVAFRPRILGCADLDVLRFASPLLSEAAIIEIESEPNGDPSKSRVDQDRHFSVPISVKPARRSTHDVPNSNCIPDSLRASPLKT